jgi:alkylation response protein AidB-like acyl-CoA dehydrogenase
LHGHSRWCQLFSEPNAGSDAAAITTRGRRVEGGWVVSGQKVWTSDARICDRGLATVRTDPEAPKHAGVTMLAIDMHAPGVQVRPLREITGETLFNEVFFDDVFVPDADVVGPVGGGWIVARATLGNERVTIGGGQSAHSFQEDELVDLLERYAPDDIGLAREVGRMIAEAWAMRAMNLRNVERSIAGEGPGPEGNITKLLSAEHAQRVTELGAAIASLAVTDGREPTLTHDLLFTRCLSIAGGTSEISRNQIAERLLGLPRDPMLRR